MKIDQETKTRKTQEEKYDEKTTFSLNYSDDTF